MKNKTVFWAAFWQGIAAPAYVFGQTSAPAPIESPTKNRSDLEAMRGDWNRIGQDISRVIARETTNAHTQ